MQLGLSAAVSAATLSASAVTSAWVTAPAAVWKRANDSSIAFFGRIRVLPRPAEMNGAYFCLRTNSTVSGSLTVVEATLSAIDEQPSGFIRQFFDAAQVERELDVLGGHLAAVVELDARA